jgi:hypothetical protein
MFKIKGDLKDATALFYPINRKIAESKTMFRTLTDKKTGKSENVQGQFVRIGDEDDFLRLKRKYGITLKKKESRFSEVEFELRYNKYLFW